MQHIRYLIEHGYSVLALHAKEKKPVGNDWTKGKGLTLAEALKHKVAGGNFGVRTGKASKLAPGMGLAVVDFDVRTTDVVIRKEALKALSNLIGDLKDHAAVLSGAHNGSAHVYLSCPISDMPKSQKIIITPDWQIELSTDGRQVVIPPSIHPTSGRAYEWLRSVDKMPPKNLLDTQLWVRLNTQKKTELVEQFHETDADETDVDALPMSDRMKDLIKYGNSEGEYPSRSEAIFAAVHALVGVGLNSDSIMGILTDPANILSEGVLERSEGWLLPQIKKATRQQFDALRKEFDNHNDETKEEEPTRLAPVPLRFIEPHTIPPTEWIIEGRLVKKFITLTVAPGGSGKTTLTIQEALSVATGKSLGISGIKEEGAVWIFNNEDPMDEMERRVAAIAYHFRLNLGELHRSGRVFINSGRKREERLILAVDHKTRGRILLEDNIDIIENAIMKNGIKLLVIDPFARTHGLNENDNSAMDLVVDAFSALADRTNCSINLVHHCRKMGSSESVAGNADTIRGASALVNAARIAHTLLGMSVEEAKGFAIDPDMRGWYCRFDSAKNNLSAPAEKAQWFKRVSVDLCNGTDKIASEHRGILEPWTPPDLEVKGVSRETERELLACIRTAWVQGQPYGAQNSQRPLSMLMKAPPYNMSSQQIRTLQASWESSGRITREKCADGTSRCTGYNAI